MVREPRTHLAMMLWAPAWGVLGPVHAADDTSEWTPVTESVRRKSVKLKGLRDSAAAEKRLPRSNGAIGQTPAAPDVPSAAPVLVKFRPIAQDRKMAPMIREFEITLPLAPGLEPSLRCFWRHVQDGGPGGHPLRFALASGRAGQRPRRPRSADRDAPEPRTVQSRHAVRRGHTVRDPRAPHDPAMQTLVKEHRRSASGCTQTSARKP